MFVDEGFICLGVQVDILVSSGFMILESRIVGTVIGFGDVKDLAVDSTDKTADYYIVGSTVEKKDVNVRYIDIILWCWTGRENSGCLDGWEFDADYGTPGFPNLTPRDFEVLIRSIVLECYSVG